MTDPEAFFGRWENVNASSNDIDRIIITRQEPGLIALHIWQSCSDASCVLETIPDNSEDLEDGTLTFSLDWKDEPLILSLRMADAGKLELASTEPASGNFEKQFFFKPNTSTFFQQLKLEDAKAANFSRTRLDGSFKEVNYLSPGTILMYQTNEGRVGKIQIRGNDVRLTMRWFTWNPDGTAFGGQDFLSIRYSNYYDMDLGAEDKTAGRSTCDFFWNDKSKDNRWLEPQNGAMFAVFHLE